MIPASVSTMVKLVSDACQRTFHLMESKVSLVREGGEQWGGIGFSRIGPVIVYFI
jgi:hypothetical protein